MDAEIKERFEKIDKKPDVKQKVFWDKIQALTGILIPIAIAAVGWYLWTDKSGNELKREVVTVSKGKAWVTPN